MLYRLYALGVEAGPRGLFAGLGPRMSKCNVQAAPPVCFSPQPSPLTTPSICPSLQTNRTLQSQFNRCGRPLNTPLTSPVMTAGLVSSQFIMYGAIKRALGARPGIEIHKEDGKSKA